MDAHALRTAIVLFDRPAVGPGGHRARARLPDPVWIDASVSGAPVRCSVAADVVRELTGVAQRPSWDDLQQAWQTIAALLERKIRAGAAAASWTVQGVPTVALTAADLPRASS
jgi:hypothetical protein